MRRNAQTFVCLEPTKFYHALGIVALFGINYEVEKRLSLSVISYLQSTCEWHDLNNTVSTKIDTD